MLCRLRNLKTIIAEAQCAVTVHNTDALFTAALAMQAWETPSETARQDTQPTYTSSLLSHSLETASKSPI